MLPILAEAFSQTFFTEQKLVQPLKIGIDKNLLAALPVEIKPNEVKRFLHGYINCAVYLRALLRCCMVRLGSI